MAELLASTIVPEILKKLSSLLLFGEAQGLTDFREEITKLEERMRSAQSVLEEAEEKQLEKRPIRLWLSELKDAAYDADDIIDELQIGLRKGTDVKTRVRNFFSSGNSLLFRNRMHVKISQLVERFDAIAAQRINNYDDVPESSTVAGRRDDTKNIVDMLFSQEESNDTITVLPMEIGFRLSEALAEAILESVKGNNFDHNSVGLSMESLQHSVRQMLSSKRYILVSDEDVTRWERMKLPMSSFGARGTALITDTPNHHNPSNDERDRYGIETSSFLVYSFAEIGVATNGLSESAKIGKGGYGSVYRGKLRGTIVAIKMLDSHSRQSRREFFQELDVLCQMHHQNLVNLIGACFECYALVYEFLPKGSIEDCLRNCSGLLTWKIRTRIIFDICSALKFLHSRSVVHGDIKPGNILIDASFNGKLADFGLCRFLPKGTTTCAFLETNPKGTLEYIDLKFLETGILRSSSDLYSFGVTILKLVTGQQPLGLSRRVYDADKSTFGKMIDATAGSWPFDLAHELAYWGLQCCYHNENSSQLMDEMWICLELMLAEITEQH